MFLRQGGKALRTGMWKLRIKCSSCVEARIRVTTGFATVFHKFNRVYYD